MTLVSRSPYSHVHLVGLVPTALAWWWTARLVRDVASSTRGHPSGWTYFDPEWVAIVLVTAVAAASLMALYGLFRIYRRSGRGLYWASSAAVWVAAFALSFVTITSVP